MQQRLIRAVVAGWVGLVVAGCASATPSASKPEGAASQAEYFVAACAAWDALFAAVGNPDTGSGSALSLKLDDAVAAGDIVGAELAAAEMDRLLAAGRSQIAVAAGWPERAAIAGHMDRIFRAFAAMTRAKLARAYDPSAPDPQAAFERAGGIEAWFAWLEAMRAAIPDGGSPDAKRCPNVPLTP